MEAREELDSEMDLFDSNMPLRFRCCCCGCCCDGGLEVDAFPLGIVMALDLSRDVGCCCEAVGADFTRVCG